MAEWLVTGVVLVLLVVLARRGYRVQEFRATAPGLMTSLGILGTFAGILIGLVAFDPAPERMRDSVESLLEGMGQAFVTSLLGLSFSIGFRVLEPYFPSTFVPTREQSEVFGRLDAICQSLTGDQSSIAGELKALRSENHDGFGTLRGLPDIIRGTLEEKLDEMVAQNADALTRQFDAHQKMVERMVGNIEQALVQQFGDTFIEFSKATHELGKWQREHAQQVEQLTKAFDLAAKSTARIAADCKEIPETMDRLGESIGVARGVMRSLNQQMETVNRQGELFTGMRDDVEQFFSATREIVELSNQQMQSLSQQMESLNQQMEMVNRQGELFTGMRNDMEQFFSVTKIEYIETIKVMRDSADGLSNLDVKLRETFGEMEKVLVSGAEEERQGRASLRRAEREALDLLRKSNDVFVALAERWAKVLGDDA